MLRWFIFLLCMLLIMPAAARMYQWTDPVTGTTQLSGKPPAWYRSGDEAPRVFVFERGRLIDDTGVSVTEERRVALRELAFVLVEEDAGTATTVSAQPDRAEQLHDLVELPQVLDDIFRVREHLDTLSDLSTLDEPPRERPGQAQPEAAASAAADPTPDQIEQLRELISTWEAEHARSMRRVLTAEDEVDDM